MIPTSRSASLGPRVVAGSSNTEMVGNPAGAIGRTARYFCGSDCSRARDAMCNGCCKRRRYQRVFWRLQLVNGLRRLPIVSSSAPDAAAFHCLFKAVTQFDVNNVTLQALVDTVRLKSYISQELVQAHHWRIEPSNSHIMMASTSSTSATRGHCCYGHIGTPCKHVRLSVIPKPCADALF